MLPVDNILGEHCAVITIRWRYALKYGGQEFETPVGRKNLRFGRLHGGEDFETPVRSGYRYGID